MDVFWKAVSVAIIAVILGVSIGKYEKDIFIVLTVIACCVVAAVAMEYLSEVIAFLWKLGNNSDFRNPFVNILLRISGVALVTELTGAISSDAGNDSLTKAVQILGNTVILFLSLPLFEAFVTTIEEIMGFV